MSKPPSREVVRAEGYEVHVVGGPSLGLSDVYHALLRTTWPGALTAIVGGYLLLNAAFALLFMASGGVANADPRSFVDAFFFSIHTMGTIGYGSMYPVTRLAGVLVVAESVTGLVVTALATGLVFARFARTRARVAFSRRVALGPMDGIPTLMIRVGNERRNRIVDTSFRLTLVRTTRTREGVVVYRAEDLPLVRDRAVTLARSWTVLHRVVPGSPLHDETPESLAAGECELTLTTSGVDDVSLQPVHAQHTWNHASVAWGARLADILSETADGNLRLDLRRFHELTEMEPSASFPYPKA